MPEGNTSARSLISDWLRTSSISIRERASAYGNAKSMRRIMADRHGRYVQPDEVTEWVNGPGVYGHEAG